MRSIIVSVLALLCSCSLRAQSRIYPLDGNAEEIVNGFDGTLGPGIEAPTDTTDRFGNPSGAMYFNGDDHIEIPIGGLTTDEFSVSAWLLVSTNPGSLQMDYYAVGDDAQDQAFGVANDGFGQGFFQAGYVDVGGAVRVFAGSLPTEDIWYHVVVTRSLTELKLYINGWLVNTTDATGTLPVYGATPLAFIGNRNTNLRPWNGIIDDLRIWDEAITADQVGTINAITDPAPGEDPVLFPDPVDDELHVVLPRTFIGAGLWVIDAMGRTVVPPRNLPAAGGMVTLSVIELATGYYCLILDGEGVLEHVPFIKR